MIRKAFLLCLAVILIGCTVKDVNLAQSPLDVSTNPTSIVTPLTNNVEQNNEEPNNEVPNNEEVNTPIDSTNQPEPQYIDESIYEGDELGVVKTLNKLIASSYEQDVHTYNSLIADNKEPIIAKFQFKGYIINIHNLDFTVNPDPSPPADTIPVIVDRSRFLFQYNEADRDEQLYVFQLEDVTWKLLYVADWW